MARTRARSTLFRGAIGATGFDPVSLFAKYSASGFYYNFAGSPTRTLGGGLLVPMYQDQAGTVVDADGESIGLAIDESQSAEVGAELVTNGTFDSDVSGWTEAADNTGTRSFTWQSGAGRLSSSGGNAGWNQSFSTTVGDWYYVTGSLAVVSGTPSALRIRKQDNNSTTPTNAQNIATAEGDSVGIFQATATTTYIHMQVNGTADVDFDDINVKPIAGNHALQTTAAAKPTFKTGSPNYASLDGGDYLDSGLVPASGMTLAACVRLDTTADIAIGSTTDGTYAQKCWLGLSSSGYAEFGFGSNRATDASDIRADDVVLLGRGNATDGLGLWLNGVQVATTAFAGTISSQAMFVGALNVGGTAGNHMQGGRIYRAFAIQSYFNDADVVPLMRALGAGVVTI